jgi:hypothetical protein
LFICRENKIIKMQTRSQTKKLLEEVNAKPLEEVNVTGQQRVLPDTILHSNLPKKKGQQYEIKIDFDEASKAWRVNKIPIGNGQFKYRGNLR